MSLADTDATTSSSRATPGDTFESFDPGSGEVVGTYPVDGVAEVAAAVERARRAAQWWRDQGAEGRSRVLKKWRSHLVNHADDLIDVVHAETGKPQGDAQLELVLAVEHLAWATKHAPKVKWPLPTPIRGKSDRRAMSASFLGCPSRPYLG